MTRPCDDPGVTERNAFIRPLGTRSTVVDVAWAVVAALVFVAPVDVELEHASLAAVLFAAGAIALRRLSPPGAMVMAVLLGVVQVTGSERPSLVDIALFVVIGTVAIVGTKPEVVLSGLLAVVAGVGATFYLASTGFRYALIISGPPDQALLAAAAPVTALLAVWAGGLAVRSWTSRNRESERRVHAEAVATRAVDEAESERIRGAIARDVHDVVGHSLAVIIAQADSVPFLQDEARIREVSATIASTARSSLLEVRQVLGHIDGTAGRVDPASLDQIVQGIRDAGVEVDHTVRGAPRPFDNDTGTAARRVLQEMLTNALRHGAPGLPVIVRETWRSGDLVLEVENVVGAAGESTRGSGRGVSGMRARLAALDGSFDAAVLDDVFAARARIPLDPHGGTPA
jgi:signal transduction histidine kinase